MPDVGGSAFRRIQTALFVALIAARAALLAGTPAGLNFQEAEDTLGHASGIFPQIFVEPHPEPLSSEDLVIAFQLLVVEPPAAVVKYVVPAVTYAERLFAERLREVGERLYPHTEGV